MTAKKRPLPKLGPGHIAALKKWDALSIAEQERHPAPPAAAIALREKWRLPAGPKPDDKLDEDIDIRRTRAWTSPFGGELPHIFLLRVSQGEPFYEYTKKQGRIVRRTWFPPMQERIKAANSCAQFFAPKLQSVRHSGDEENPIVVKTSDTETARRVAFLLVKGMEYQSEE